MSKATDEGIKFMRKRMAETGKPFDEIELPKMLAIVEATAKKEIFDKFDGYACIKNDDWYLKLKKQHLKNV